MQKIKLLATLLIVYCFLLIGATPTFASVLSIQSLPSYVTNNSFKLSCTASGNSAQFSFKKEGGTYATFGSAIDLTTSACQVQVTSSQVGDEAKYFFKVTVDGVDSSETSTTFDRSGPGSVSGYYKERINDGMYKLHYRNPGDTDFDKVVIYRGESADFSADNSHEIARVSGSPNSDMTYDDNFTPDAGKNYFYIIRALDHAGNSSGIVGDGGTTTSSATPKAGVLGATTNSTGKVTTLPKEGSVLGTEATSSPAPTASSSPVASENVQNSGILAWVMGHKKISLGVIVLALLAYYFLKSKKS